MHKHDIQNNSGMNVTISGFDMKRRVELNKNVKISIKYSASPKLFSPGIDHETGLCLAKYL